MFDNEVINSSTSLSSSFRVGRLTHNAAGREHSWNQTLAFCNPFLPFMQMSHSGCNAGKYLKRYVPLSLYAAAAVVTVTDTMLWAADICWMLSMCWALFSWTSLILTPPLCGALTLWVDPFFSGDTKKLRQTRSWCQRWHWNTSTLLSKPVLLTTL